MEWSKLKNIVLVLLLMTNGLLLVVVVGQEGELLKQERQARQSAIELLQSWGIALDEEIVPENITLQPLYLHRDQEKEERFASGLLGEGEVSTEKLSGDIFRYSGQNGAVQFHSEGELQIWLTPGSIQQEAELVTDDAKNRMQAWGMEGEVLLVEEENEGTTVILRQMIENQNYVSWTKEALDEEAEYVRWTRLGYLVILAMVVTTVLLGYWYWPRS